MSGEDLIACVRCRREAPTLGSTPYPGRLGEEIRANVCADCWREWQNAEVMVINELRLNFMDPRSQEILVQHLREFLALDAPARD
jgi:Fe-S cluster biosynthesis and repair protein YggX